MCFLNLETTVAIETVVKIQTDEVAGNIRSKSSSQTGGSASKISKVYSKIFNAQKRKESCQHFNQFTAVLEFMTPSEITT